MNIVYGILLIALIFDFTSNIKVLKSNTKRIKSNSELQKAYEGMKEQLNKTCEVTLNFKSKYNE